MALTQADLAQRLRFVGASEVGAVLGCDEYRTPLDIWLLKTGRVEPGAAGDAADLGNRLEPIVLDWAEESLGPLERNRRGIREDLFIGATFDALTEDLKPVEAKTSGLLGPLSPDWGDAHSDQVPDRIVIQAHAQMIVAQSEVCFVPALLGWRGFVMFRVELDEVLAAEICDRVPAWWKQHVIDGEPPDGCASPSILKRRVRVPEKVAVISPVTAMKYRAACDAMKEAEAAKDGAYASLLGHFDDAEIGDFGDSKQWFTFKESWRTSLDIEALRRDHPDLYAKYSRQSSSRSLRLANRPKAPKSKGE